MCEDRESTEWILGTGKRKVIPRRSLKSTDSKTPKLKGKNVLVVMFTRTNDGFSHAVFVA